MIEVKLPTGTMAGTFVQYKPELDKLIQLFSSLNHALSKEEIIKIKDDFFSSLTAEELAKINNITFHLERGCTLAGYQCEKTLQQRNVLVTYEDEEVMAVLYDSHSVRKVIKEDIINKD